MRTDLQGLVDLLPSGLGSVQCVDELNVVQQVASRTGEQLQDLILQLSLQGHAPNACRYSIATALWYCPSQSSTEHMQ